MQIIQKFDTVSQYGLIKHWGDRDCKSWNKIDSEL